MYLVRKVGSKGQVVIPQEVREELGFSPDSSLRFDVQGNKMIVEKVEDGSKWLEEFLSIIPKDNKVKNGSIDYKKILDTEFDEKNERLLGHRRVHKSSSK